MVILLVTEVVSWCCDDDANVCRDGADRGVMMRSCFQWYGSDQS